MPDDAAVDTEGFYEATSIGYAWHCACGWTTARHRSVDTVTADAWQHCLDTHHMPTPLSDEPHPRPDAPIGPDSSL